MNSKVVNNAHKITYLVQQNPEKTLGEIIRLLGMPGIEINTGIWYAVGSGLLTEPNTETGEIDLGAKVPTKWDFGPELETLREMLVYSFKELAKKENDLEENYLANWIQGYPKHDTKIAISTLIEEKKLAEYAVEDGDSTYIFYTSYENRDKLWGRHQFKKDPLEGASDDVEQTNPPQEEKQDEAK